MADTAQEGTSVHNQRWDNAYLYLEAKDNLDTSAGVSTPQNTARTSNTATTLGAPEKRQQQLLGDCEVDEAVNYGLASMLDVDMDTHGCHCINKKPAASPSIELRQQERAIPPPMVATSQHGDKCKAEHEDSMWSRRSHRVQGACLHLYASEKAATVMHEVLRQLRPTDVDVQNARKQQV